MTISIYEQIKCIERELKYRKHVYPRLVMQGKMDSATAEKQIKAMTAVLETLQRTAPQEGLFSPSVSNGDTSAK